MPKGRRGSRGKKTSEALDIRIESEIDDSRFPAGTDYADVHRRAVARRARGGGDTPGVRLIGHFRNPDRRDSYKARWKSTDDGDQNLDDFFSTLQGPINALLSQMQQGLREEKPAGGGGPIETPEERVFLKRSEAAKRGAETRRVDRERAVKLAAAYKRSQAAKRGAATRAAKRHKFL